MSLVKSLTVFFLEFLETAALALLFFALMYLVAFQPHQVNGNSMLPNFIDKEYLLTNKLSYRFGEVQRGDVVIFKAPDNPDYEYIKRVIGLPGDSVAVKDGKFWVNGQPIDESSYLPLTTYTAAGNYLRAGREIVLSANAYFVSGDNRSNSSDSRDFGPVPEKNLVGKAWFSYWPPTQVGLIKHEQYTYSSASGFDLAPAIPR